MPRSYSKQVSMKGVCDKSPTNEPRTEIAGLVYLPGNPLDVVFSCPNPSKSWVLV